ncbi:MAG: hypothetical protein WC679_12315 [Bacteroidales bacterium]|jgi:hypothetical protein
MVNKLEDWIKLKDLWQKAVDHRCADENFKLYVEASRNYLDKYEENFNPMVKPK